MHGTTSHLPGSYICHKICYGSVAFCSINLVWCFNGVICFIAESSFLDLKTEQEDNIMLKCGLPKDWAVKDDWKRPDKRHLCERKSFQIKTGVKVHLKSSGELSQHTQEKVIK